MADNSCFLGPCTEALLPILAAATARLPDASAGCGEAACPGRRRVYVALSMRLIATVLLTEEAPQLRPYVFKVGTTSRCLGAGNPKTDWERSGRSLTLNGSTTSRPGRPDAAPYAGFADWRVVGCWAVPADTPDRKVWHYDEMVFSRWIRGLDSRWRPTRKPVEGVRWASYDWAPSSDPGRARPANDLFVMERRFVQGGVTGIAPHTLHDAMLLAVRASVGGVVLPMVEQLRPFAARVRPAGHRPSAGQSARRE